MPALQAHPVRRTEGTQRAFTVLELLIVIAIIGILLSIGLPALKGFGQANLVGASYRQLLDDLARARLHAISERTTVYMVFTPPYALEQFNRVSPADVNTLKQLTNMIPRQFNGYAIMASRTVGDQPGRHTPRYLTEWKSLPEGMLFAPYKFEPQRMALADEYMRSFPTNAVPFPNAVSPYFPLPYIAFDPQGQLVNRRDEIIALARGSVFYPKNKDDSYRLQSLSNDDVVLNPQPKPPRGTNAYYFIRVNWLTGRAKAEIADF